MRAPRNHKTAWSPEEDDLLKDLVHQFGERRWAVIANHMTGRVGKQCRERWRNHLDPTIKHGRFTREEDEVVMRLVQEMGTKWARISELMQGRTENSIKNRYYSHLKKILDPTPPPPPPPQPTTPSTTNTTRPRRPSIAEIATDYAMNYNLTQQQQQQQQYAVVVTPSLPPPPPPPPSSPPSCPAWAGIVMRRRSSETELVMSAAYALCGLSA